MDSKESVRFLDDDSIVPQTDFVPNNYVKFEGDPEQQSPRMSDMLSTKNYNLVTVTKLLSSPVVQQFIFNSNVFILGKVGFFDQIINALKKLYPHNLKIKIIRTENELVKIQKTKKRKDNSMSSGLPNFNEIKEPLPFILLPTAYSQEGLNHLVTLALEAKHRVWLVAIPSQIQRQLLLSFGCFFLSPDPNTELEIFKGITPINKEDVALLKNHMNVKALFVADQVFKNIGESGRLGTVAYISDLGM